MSSCSVAVRDVSLHFVEPQPVKKRAQTLANTSVINFRLTGFSAQYADNIAGTLTIFPDGVKGKYLELSGIAPYNTAMPYTNFAVFFVFFLLGLFVRAEDCSQWGEKFSRNPVSPETNLPVSFEPGKRHSQTELVDPVTTQNVRWTAPVGEVIYGTPVAAEGCVFAGSNTTTLPFPQLQGDKGVFTCLDEKTGKHRWELVVPKLVEIQYADWHRVGMCSTPVIENGKIYLVTNRGDILCLDINGLADGNQGTFQDENKYAVPAGEPPLKVDDVFKQKFADILWRCSMVDTIGVMPHNASNCSVLMDGDVLYVCTGNGVDWTHSRVMNPEAPTLIAVDKNNGTLLAVDRFGMGPDIMHGQWSSPSLGVVNGKRLVFQGTGSGWLFAVEALTPQQVEAARTNRSENTKPLALKTVWKFNGHPLAQTQEVVPMEHFHDTKSYEVVGNPVFVNNRLYVIFTQELYHNIPNGWLVCLDAAKTGDTTRGGGLLWSYTDISSSGSTVAVKDGLVYVADNKGRLHCLDADTGKPYWIHNLGGNQVWGSPLLADGKVYIGTGRRLFWCLKQGKMLEVLGKVPLPGPVYASITAANGTLYVPVFGTLYAVKNE